MKLTNGVSLPYTLFTEISNPLLILENHQDFYCHQNTCVFQNFEHRIVENLLQYELNRMRSVKIEAELQVS